MPPWSILVEELYMVLPALLAAAMVMAAVELLGGAKQAPAAAALALMTGAILGLWLRDAGKLFVDDKADLAWGALPSALSLISGESSWNRFAWAALGALCAGRVVYLADVHAQDGWLLRGGAAIAIAWWVIPETSRDEIIWLAPAYALIVWLLWFSLDKLAAQPASSSVAGCLILSLFTAAGVLIYAGTKRLMDANVVLALALVGITLVAFLRGVEFGGVIPAIAVLLPGILLMGQQTRSAEREMHWCAFALPAFAPLALAVTLPFSHWPRWRVHLLRLVLILIPLVIAMVLAREAGELDWGEDWSE
jgi:hypothetical protein